MYKCLCCGLETLPVPSEEAVAFICPVCWWENDVFVKSDEEASDENKGISLKKARENYKKYRIAHPQFITEWIGRLDIGWQDLIRKAAKEAKTFEIYCRNDEIKQIEMALQFGHYKKGIRIVKKVIVGNITDDFIEMLVNAPRPTDTTAYYKRTPFCCIFFDNGFESLHYGAEIKFST